GARASRLLQAGGCERPGSDAEIEDRGDVARHGAGRDADHLFVVWNERPDARVVLGDLDAQVGRYAHDEASGSYPGQVTTGSTGYLGNVGSSSDRRQR